MISFMRSAKLATAAMESIASLRSSELATPRGP
jgi:hypothetical protein